MRSVVTLFSVLGTLGLLGACRLFVDTEGLKGGAGPDAGSDGRVDQPGPDGSPGLDAAPDAGPLGPQPGVGITRTGDGTQASVDLSVAGRFAIDFQRANGFQASGWRDLATDANLGLTAPRGLNGPYDLGGPMDQGFYNPAATLTVLSDSPAAVSLRTVGEADFVGTRVRTTVDYTVFASGRIAEVAIAANVGAAAVPSFNWFEYAHTNLNTAQAWTALETFSGNAFAFSLGQKSNVLVVNRGNETSISKDNDQNRYWAAGGNVTTPWAPGATVVRQWELVVWPPAQTATDMAARVADQRAPGIAVVSGATEARFDAAHGIYAVVGAGGGAVSVRLTGAEARVAPAFVIAGWPSPKFTLRRNGRELANTTVPTAKDAVVGYDAAQKALVISTSETIPAGASDADRTFLVEP